MGFSLGGAIGGALGGITGAIIGKRSSDKQHNYQTHVEQRNREQDYDFAKNQIKWRVQDAKEAGIHPLAALGAQTTMPSAHIASGPSGMGGMSQAMSNIGQDIGRAITAASNQYQRKMMDINLDNAEMDSEMKHIELINKRKSLENNVPPGLVRPVAAEVTSHSKGRKNIEAGTITQTGYFRNRDGSLTPIPSKDVKERTEDQIIPEMVWAGKNYIAPAFGSKGNKPPKSALPKGAKDWEWSISTMSWRPVKHKARGTFKRIKDTFKKYKKKLGY